MDLGRVVRHAPRDRPGGARDAAVLVPLLERPDGWAVLFTKRAAHLGEHPRQMSFPGGGDEPGDGTLQATALREAWEEIGLEPEEVTVIGRLDDIQTVTGYRVRPFVATIPDRTYEPNYREVEEIVILPVASLVDSGNYAAQQRRHPKFGTVTVRYFTAGGYTVWGATAKILAQLLRVGAGWHPPADPPDGEPPSDQIVDDDGRSPTDDSTRLDDEPGRSARALRCRFSGVAGAFPFVDRCHMTARRPLLPPPRDTPARMPGGPLETVDRLGQLGFNGDGGTHR